MTSRSPSSLLHNLFNPVPGSSWQHACENWKAPTAKIVRTYINQHFVMTLELLPLRQTNQPVRTAFTDKTERQYCIACRPTALTSDKFSVTLQDRWKKRRFTWLQQTEAKLYIAGVLGVFEAGHGRLILNPFQFVIHSQSTFQHQQPISVQHNITVLFEKLIITQGIRRFL